MIEVKDWKGNVVKEGDEICLIRTKMASMFNRSGFAIPNGKGSYKVVYFDNNDTEEDQDCWIVGEPIKVLEGFTYKYKEIVDNEEYFITSHISLLTCFQHTYTLLAIVGVSDKKD